jgi:hypothetical protein
MDASSALPKLVVENHGRLLGPSAAPAMVLAGVALFASMAGLLLARRAAGAFESPLSFAELVATAALVSSVMASLRVLWAAQAARPVPRWLWLSVHAALSVALLALGAAVSVPGTRPAAGIVFWLLLATGEAAGWFLARAWPRLRHRARAAPQSAKRPRRMGIPSARAAAAEGASALVDEPLAAALVAPIGEEIQQHLLRCRTADGGELVRGRLRAAFRVGQRTAAAHVAFCPPLAGVPALSSRQVEGPPARIKHGQVLSHGARFDIKLAEPIDMPAAVVIEFSAAAPPRGPLKPAAGP